VRVKLEESDGVAQLSVMDDGVGLSPEVLARIFDRFYRTHDAEEREVSGLGLGLFISRSLVQAHGGRIWAASDGHGKGSTFTVALPSRRWTPPSYE
jgi:signal transduction histidine kinase